MNLKREGLVDDNKMRPYRRRPLLVPALVASSLIFTPNLYASTQEMFEVGNERLPEIVSYIQKRASPYLEELAQNQFFPRNRQ